MNPCRQQYERTRKTFCVKLRRIPRPIMLPALAIAAAGLALSGCSSSTSTEASPTVSVSTPAPAGEQVEFDANLTSDYSKTYQVGAGGSKVFGVNILAGSTKINGERVKVEVLGTVDYDAGSGPFGSFLSLEWPDGTVLGAQLDGQATKGSETEATSFLADLNVIEGSGAAEGVAGVGKFTGSRSGPLATEIAVAVTLDLTDAPTMITGS